MYRLRILEAAAHELARLDRSVAHRIVRRIHWLAANLDNIQPEMLRGDLAGLYKLRVGNYRVVYEVLREERTIMVHLIGHRREVYRRR